MKAPHSEEIPSKFSCKAVRERQTLELHHFLIGSYDGESGVKVRGWVESGLDSVDSFLELAGF